MQDSGQEERMDEAGTFRAQLPLPELQELYDYWLSRHTDRGLPRRADIDPVHIPKLLPGICLMEIARPGLDVKVRLAGTRLRLGYGMELTGHRLEEMLRPDEVRYWQAVTHRLAAQRKPAHGITRIVAEGRPHYHQVWVRLPLADDDGEVAMMIGYDAFLMSTKADALIKDTGKVAQIA